MKPDASMDEPILPSVPFKNCPIQASLGVLGRKWTLLILRDIGFRQVGRFNEISRSIDGLTPRVLSMRLKELESEGIIQKTADEDSGLPRWSLTDKGRDTLPILMRIIAFGAKWYPQTVFKDRSPRTLAELFPQEAAKPFIKA